MLLYYILLSSEKGVPLLPETKTYLTSAEQETEKVGRTLAEDLLERGEASGFVALYGDLGVGKTAFVRGFVSALSPARVKSPTYTIVNEYRGGKVPVFHFDMYRIEGEDDLYSTGYYDYLGAGWLLCEWCEKIPFALPGDRITVTVEKTDGGDGRRITVAYPARKESEAT